MPQHNPFSDISRARRILASSTKQKKATRSPVTPTMIGQVPLMIEKSTSGYVFPPRSKVISWLFKKQQTVALSLSEMDQLSKEKTKWSVKV